MLQGPGGDTPTQTGLSQDTWDSGHQVNLRTRTTQEVDATQEVIEEEITGPDGETFFTGTTTRTFGPDGKTTSETTERSDGRTKPIRAPKAHERRVESRHLSLDQPSNWSVSLGAHYGRRDFKNSQALDHNSFGGRLAAGFRLNFGNLLQHKLIPRLFYDFSYAQKVIVEPLKSQAQLHSFGAEVAYLNEALGHWLYVGGALSLGATISRSSSDRYGLTGVNYNDSLLRRPLNESAFRFELGPRLCTWGMRVCLDAKMVSDMSLDPSIGDGLREGLTATGFDLGLSVDIMQFFSKPSPKGYLELHRPKGVRAAKAKAHSREES